MGKNLPRDGNFIMPIIIKTKEEIEVLREGGKHLATVLYKVRDMVAPGVSTKDLDLYAEKLIRERGDTPAFLNYRPEGPRLRFRRRFVFR